MNRMKQRLLTFMISAALVIGIFPAIPAIADTDDNTSSEESIYVLYTNDVHCEDVYKRQDHSCFIIDNG